MQSLVHRLLGLRLWLEERFKPGEATVTLVWAAAIGCLGGLSASIFRQVVIGLRWLFVQNTLPQVDAASWLPWWQRLAVPAVGGLCAGLVLHYGSNLTRGRRARDYMETIAIGNGTIRLRPTLVRISSSLFSIASGGSIGREGAMSQLAAMLASQVAVLARLPRPRARLMIACGAAAGIAAAYNAPIGGALFIAEVVLGSIAMQSFGPLLVASVMSTIVARTLMDGSALFAFPTFHFVNAIELVTYLMLGLITGACAQPFMLLLEKSAAFFQSLALPIWGRLAFGGLIVGAISIQHPYVWGNGADALSRILETDWVWSALLALLFFKLVATAATVGSGAVGGVFTPTLLVGAAIGALFGTAVHAALPTVTGAANGYAVVGMGAFLAGTTHAPLMAILILFDMTLNHDIVLPLMVAVVGAYSASRALRGESIYAHALRYRDDDSEPRLATMLVRDLVKPDPPSVDERARFDLVVATFARNQHHNLYVVDPSHRFRGVIPLHEIKPFLHNEQLAQLVIAQDLVVEDFPIVGPDSTLEEALAKFSVHPGERLPVVEPEGGWLVGSLSKTDLLLTLAHAVERDEQRP
jgi:CIC family chloride channel protein